MLVAERDFCRCIVALTKAQSLMHEAYQSKLRSAHNTDTDKVCDQLDFHVVSGDSMPLRLFHWHWLRLLCSRRVGAASGRYWSFVPYCCISEAARQPGKEGDHWNARSLHHVNLVCDDRLLRSAKHKTLL